MYAYADMWIGLDRIHTRAHTHTNTRKKSYHERNHSADIYENLFYRRFVNIGKQFCKHVNIIQWINIYNVWI